MRSGGWGSFGKDDRAGQNWGSEVTELVLVWDGASGNGETCTIRFFEMACFLVEVARMKRVGAEIGVKNNVYETCTDRVRM